MDYNKHYNALIDRSKNRAIPDIFEKHHIIPRCLGGSNETDNIARLTPEEHYVAHQLLVKLHPTSHALVYAAQMMCVSSGRLTRSNKLYGWLKRKHLVMCKQRIGTQNSSYGTRWIHNVVLCTNKKIKKTDIIPDGWLLGRKLLWGARIAVCAYCNTVFMKTQGRFCSDACKHANINDKVAADDACIAAIATDYEICYNSIVKNSAFILKLLELDLPQHRIFKFLKCNSSGANYKTFNQLRACSSTV